MNAQIEKLLATKNRCYLVCTGAGAGAGLQNVLWQIPGISAVLVGAEFPYAPEATDRFLGFKLGQSPSASGVPAKPGFAPAKYCSEDTAIALAMEAYSRAFILNGPEAIGIGLTASVASTVAHRGDHRVFIGRADKTGVKLYSETLVKGVGPIARISDGIKCDTLALMALTEHENLGMVDVTDRAMELFFEHPYFLSNGQRQGLPDAQREVLPESEPGARGLATEPGLVLFPGAFNPPHEGHKWLARHEHAVFHITTNPPHKSTLSVIECIERAKLLEGFDRMFTQDDPLYLDKARRFPGATFIVGVDALERMLDPVWGVPVEPLLNEFRELGTKFLVADRAVGGVVKKWWKTVKNAPLDICSCIHTPENLAGLSSTALRGEK